MSDQPPPPSPRARLQTLLAIPERQRTDEQWDEINELEIMLASANREGAPDQQRMHGNMGQQGGRPNNPGGGGRPHHGGGGKKQQRRFHQRPRQRNPR